MFFNIGMVFVIFLVISPIIVLLVRDGYRDGKRNKLRRLEREKKAVRPTPMRERS